MPVQRATSNFLCLPGDYVHNCSHINSIIFDTEGKRLYSGDGDGEVIEWLCGTSGGAERHTSFKANKSVKEPGGDAVSCLRLNPRGSRLL
eukprot:SAG11_NODE_17279_length_523_cov_0.849057_1_plen_89_part_10